MTHLTSIRVNTLCRQNARIELELPVACVVRSGLA